MTKTEWAIVEEKLRHQYQPVALMCDGYHVTLTLSRISQTRLAIVVEVNGKLQMYEKDAPELRFFYPSKRSVMSAADKRDLAKEPKWLQKRLVKSNSLFDPKATYTVWCSYWGSFKALRAHYTKNNSEIELLKTWQYEVQS